MAISTQNEFRYVQRLFLPDGSGAGGYDTVDEMAVVKHTFPFLSWPGTPAATDPPHGHPSGDNYPSSVHYLTGGS
jgi:hypothetical protein